MQQDRSRLALALLSRAQYDRVEAHADQVLGFFEDLGLLLRRGIASKHFVWAMNCYYILRYWQALQGYIEWVRAARGDSTYYAEFEFLYGRMCAYELKVTKKRSVTWTRTEIREFLIDELHITLRPHQADDLGRILAIEKASFLEADAYSEATFEELRRDHGDCFFVAEILGQVVGYIVGYSEEEGKGEIDSLAVDPRFRQFGVGERLTKCVLDWFGAGGLTVCTLEVRPANTDAIRLYEKIGFKINRTISRYYDDETDAYLMEMPLVRP
jgi:[ribosomal protein S18]-alanine N-acetyltransferase